MVASVPALPHMLGLAKPEPELTIVIDPTEIDWTGCDDVERIPGKVSGQPIVKNTRILADGVIVNAESGISPEELANEHFPGLGVERARRIIAFARQHAPHPA
jgi:uncharacterized protein (DUF433 family)